MKASILLVVLAACAGDVIGGSGPDPDPGKDDGSRDAATGRPDGGVGPGTDASGPGADGGTTTVQTGTFLLTLDHGAFPPTSAHPSALVYVPAGFDPTPPLGLVVYIHGFWNCVANSVLEEWTPCTAGGEARSPAGMARQLEASGRNAIFLAPEVAYDQASGNAGALGNTNGFRALVAEVLEEMTPAIGAFTVDDVGRVVLLSHSGAYVASASIITRGGITIDELFLLDSLYGQTASFDTWVRSDLPGITAELRRFGNIYTGGGGTLSNSQAMADRASDWVTPAALFDDRTAGAIDEAEFHHGLFFKRTDESHADVPFVFAEPILRTSGL